MHRPSLRLIGLLVLLLGVSLYAASRYWIATRHYLLLSVPISLAPGESTHSLHVQDEGNYELFLYTLIRTYEKTRVRAFWSITGREGTLEGGGDEYEMDAWKFARQAHLKPGNYTLRFKVFSDTAQLNEHYPVLHVNADAELYRAAMDRYEALSIFSCFLGVVGVVLVLFSFRTKVAEYPIATGTAETVTVAAQRIAVRVKRFPGDGRRLRLPRFGFVAAVFFALMVMVLMVLTGNRHISRGLWVQLLKPGGLPQTSDKWSKPIIVRVSVKLRTDGKKHLSFGGRYSPSYTYEHHYFVNDEEVPEKELRDRLRALLVTRTDRTVYIKGSSDLLFEPVARAVDVAKGAYASRVVLLTDAEP